MLKEANWNDDSGDWKGLASDVESLRYEAIASYLNQMPGDITMLDCGSGESLLSRYIRSGVSYVGIEPSQKALETSPLSGYTVHETVEGFSFGANNWDAIIFNESLYYLKNPYMVLEKAMWGLKSHGLLIASIFQKPHSFMDELAIFRMTNLRATAVIREFFWNNLYGFEDIVEKRLGGKWIQFIAKVK